VQFDDRDAQQYAGRDSKKRRPHLPKKIHDPIASQSDPPPWEILQERILAVLNDYADDNPVVPDALLLTGAGLAYVTFATTRYGADAFQNVYENLRSIVQLFQLIIDDERRQLPKRSLKESTNKKKALTEKWDVLESIRKKLSVLVEQEIKRIQEQSPKAN
jgi:hypothetical protein